jgi:L-threonylcarbamoyladenylate synthase
MAIETKILKISPELPDESIIGEAADILRGGGIVAFPTETVYGLGADALNEHAVREVFSAKGRPPDNPLIVHIADIGQMEELSPDVTENARLLTKHFWPGPLTVILKVRPHIPKVVTGGLDTIALRMPAHNVPLALIKNLGRGIVGPSANLSGKPSPTTAQHVYDDLQGKIAMILDSGPTIIGVESTVIDVTHTPPVILRLGGTPKEEIEKIVGRVETTADHQMKKRSPGTRYRHYAPKARVILVPQGNRFVFKKLIDQQQSMKRRIGCILNSLTVSKWLRPEEMNIITIPSEEYANKIFDTLRKLDQAKVHVILIETVPETGLGAAVMDRLKRAAE